MDFFKILILLGTVGNVFCGGESKCGVLKDELVVLLQAFESMIYGVVNLVNNSMISSPMVGDSNIANYFCSLNATTYTFAMEISRMSGMNIDYILGALEGSIQHPFLEPLDCIDIELTSYYLLTQNIDTNIVPQWEALVQNSPINESTPCSTVLQIESSYFQQDIQTATTGLNAAINRAALFVNVGKTSLYLDYMNSLKICSSNTLIDRIAEILNIDPSIVAEYLANETISVPPPLSCIQGLVSSLADTVNSTYNTINSAVANPNPTSNCEPFLSQFVAFEDVWIKYVNELRDHAINQSIAYPELTPFFISNLLCEVDAMVMFATNATSLLSGIHSDIIYSILKGSIMPPYVEPLDCIANKLLFMHNQISILVNSIIPGLQNFAVNSTSDTSTCNQTYRALTPYVGRLVTILNKKGLIMNNATIDFKSINMNDLFLETYFSVLDCLPDLVGKYAGSALNGNGASVAEYVSGNRSSLPYPFTCVKIIIDILNSISFQAHVNFVTESATNVVVAPNVPVYRG